MWVSLAPKAGQAICTGGWEEKGQEKWPCTQISKVCPEGRSLANAIGPGVPSQVASACELNRQTVLLVPNYLIGT